MINNTNIDSLQYTQPYINDAELKLMLKPNTSDSLYAKVKRMKSSGALLHLRRGLYCLNDNLESSERPLHPFEAAQHIYGPSCISLESALSFHQLIPEAVYTITSVCVKRSKEFTTPIGVFSFIHTRDDDFYTEVDRLVENGYVFLIARPWRAICDYVYCYKKNWYGVSPLLNSLRTELDDLPKLNKKTINTLLQYYKSKRIEKFLIGIYQDLNVTDNTDVGVAK